MARRHVPTEATRAAAKSLAGFGHPQDQIAGYLGIDEVTLRKHYRDDLDEGMRIANQPVARNLWKIATADVVGDPGDPAKGIPPKPPAKVNANAVVTAAIYWTKVRMGWREKEPMLPLAGPAEALDPVESDKLQAMTDEDLERLYNDRIAAGRTDKRKR